MKIAVLFDGAGLSRLGLEQAGHACTGYEKDECKHYLSTMVGSGNSVLADVRDVDLSGYDAIWASPPCQEWSDNNQGTAAKTGELLDWSLSLIERYPEKTIWIENVLSRKRSNAWGTLFNAAQFLVQPIQNRPRVIKVHNAPLPVVYRSYERQYPDLDICPTVVASERSGQRRGIDRRFTHRDTGIAKTVDYKADFRAAQTGNAFIETVSVDTKGKAGWAVASQADWILYYVPETRRLYVLDSEVIHRWLPLWVSLFPVAQARNEGYATHGVLLPLDVLAGYADAVVEVP